MLGDAVILITSLGVSTSTLYAVDPDLGSAKWAMSLDCEHDPRISEALPSGNLVFFAVSCPSGKLLVNKTTLYAIETATGHTKWKFDVPVETRGLSPASQRPYSPAFPSRPMLIVGKTICFGTEKGVFAFELTSGHRLWNFGKETVSKMVADDQHIFVTIQQFYGAPRAVHAVTLSDGKEGWSRELIADADLQMASNGVLYAGGLKQLQALDAATGREIWTIEGAVTVRTTSANKIFLTRTTGIAIIGNHTSSEKMLQQHVESGANVTVRSPSAGPNTVTPESIREEPGYLEAIDMNAAPVKP